MKSLPCFLAMGWPISTHTVTALSQKRPTLPPSQEGPARELAALTPAVRHDLQSQGHQVIEGGIQDNSTDVWVGHGCPRG